MGQGLQRADMAPVGVDIINISASVSSLASALAAGVGPFRGLYIKTSTSLTLISISGTSLTLDNLAKNTTLWIQGDYLSVIATATAQVGLL